MPAFEWFSASFGAALKCPRLDAVARHLFTTRGLTLRGARADEEWAQLAQAIGVAPARLFAPKQVHGTGVLVVRAGDLAAVSLNDPSRPHADIVMTAERGSAVAVQVADCVPVLLADTATGAVAAVHAGWRGAAAGAVRTAVEAMVSEFGTRPNDLVAAIGPSIRACCYEVGPEVRAAFSANGFEVRSVARWFAPQPGSDRLLLDVPLANRDQLIDAGVDAHSVIDCGLCTRCHPERFFSYRREGAATGRLAAVITPNN